jgi:hypothetical protein
MKEFNSIAPDGLLSLIYRVSGANLKRFVFGVLIFRKRRKISATVHVSAKSCIEEMFCHTNDISHNNKTSTRRKMA